MTEEEVTQPAAVRKIFDLNASRVQPPKPSNVIEHSSVIAGPNNTRVRITHVRPAGSENTVLPAILYIHGGGWVFGSMKTHGPLVYALAQQTPAAVIFIGYSPSPEAQYPVALEECYAALTWMTDNAQSLYIDPKRIAVGGDSAGGNLTTALCMLCKERGNKTITYQILYYPVLGTDFNTPSYIEHKDSNMVARHMMMYVWDAYADPSIRAKEVKAVPRNASNEDLKGLPPTLIVTADYDTLKDEGAAYAKQLIAAGVETVPVNYFAVQHGFMTTMDKPQTKAALAQTIDLLKKAWNDGPSKL
ncbi:alpha/beta hydrolase fold-domain-containing protein [Zychaea mexicana]|uniref:alpha/beta hydrolase fold-domain-containing protein n=1 Tax=Zychaea mexicana TaxID=64656 RepID=UPI0022FE9474|nr:alpha/beta hydrolase fold-domain-containing protein [Zychaea mexicana]KAI9494048.1 alpha/beta hydrolase fold-domain-containing protein [Zychaea mexicana]